jgi:hypothetical protein
MMQYSDVQIDTVSLVSRAAPAPLAARVPAASPSKWAPSNGVGLGETMATFVLFALSAVMVCGALAAALV